MKPESNLFDYNKTYKLESGESLPGFQLQYTTLGRLNASRTNVVWICHALTGNSDFTTWWDGLFGQGKAFDPQDHFIICANTLGGCYGSTGPLSINPLSKQPYHHKFPFITNRDIVGSFELLREELNIDIIHTLIGGSLGGQQALEWAISHPFRVKNLIQVASNAKHSPWGIAFNESQRQAIAQDLTWQLDTDTAGLNGMKVARSIALLSYRSYQTYQLTQIEQDDEATDHFKAASYQVYQGEKLAKRFNAYTYWALSKAMDAHNVGRGRGGIRLALGMIKARTLFIGITSDVLFPVQEQQFLAENVAGSTLGSIDSAYGHDGFLIEWQKLTTIIQKFNKEKALQAELICKTR